jgi:predicted transcriptional regulator
MIAVLAEVLEIAKTWPEEDQEALAEAAHEIQAHRDGVYVLADDERAAVEEGLSQARRGEFATDAEVEKFWTRLEA